MLDGLVRRWWPWVLGLLCLLVYARSLSGGFLVWDDPILVTENRILGQPSWGSLRSVLFAFDAESRRTLGAEYLPVRDLTVLAEVALFGLKAALMRATNLALYAAATMAIAAALRRSPYLARYGWLVAAAIFAVHPVHVESVAWISGRKDCLAMLFVALGLLAYGTNDRRKWWTPLILALAVLSKAQAVVGIGLLVAHDLLLRRRPEFWALGLSALLVGAATLLHHRVGGLVGTVISVAPDRREVLWITMGEVLLKYLGLLVWPGEQSIEYDVRLLEHWGWVSVAGWSVVLGTLIGALVIWRYRSPIPLVIWLWTVVPLIPVSQVVVTLPNLMAERYLLFSVLGPAIGVGYLVDRFPRYLTPVVALVIGIFAVKAEARAKLFRDSIGVFTEATARTKTTLRAPFKLGEALWLAGRREEAVAAFEEVRLRGGDSPEELNVLAALGIMKLRFGAGDVSGAIASVDEAAALWPGSEHVRSARAWLLGTITARQPSPPAVEAPPRE